MIEYDFCSFKRKKVYAQSQRCRLCVETYYTVASITEYLNINPAQYTYTWKGIYFLCVTCISFKCILWLNSLLVAVKVLDHIFP